MDLLRASAAAAAPAKVLSWRDSDDVADWILTLGTDEYRVHTAVLASGARRSDKVRAALLTTKNGSRKTDVAALLPESGRTDLLADPLMKDTFELMLDYVYGVADGLSLPSFRGSTAGVAVEKPKPKSDPAADDGDGDTMLSYFSTAIFGTPSKEPSSSATEPAAAAASGRAEAAAPPKTRAVKAAQVPLLWQLADCLTVRGLKTALLPLFEEALLPAHFTMATPAYERLKMLIRSIELHASEVVAALCEQLRIPRKDTPGGPSMREVMSDLAVAAAACDPSRYDSLSRVGLLPAEQAGLLAILDKSSLRVASEAQVHDLIRFYIKHTKASAANQEALWAACRFTYLPADRLVSLSETPNVPPRWLALACAQRAAALGGTKAPATASATAVEAARLTPRDYYS